MAKKETSGPTRPPTPAQRAWELLRAALRARLAEPTRSYDQERLEFEERVPKEQRANIDEILEEDPTPSKAYRTLLIIQLAYRLSLGRPLELTRQQPGGRGHKGVAGLLHALLREAHVTSPVDAYQNIGKGSGTLANRNFAPSDSFLTWASETARTDDQLEIIFRYACTRIMATARPIAPMPQLDASKLTFAAVMALFVV